jgi:mannitol/fructose-specific phosphotransferase system IIA component (Ntr-type)
MAISEIIKRENIIIGAKSGNRWDLFREMIELAVKNRDVPKSSEEIIVKALIEREKSMSTGIGRGVAIPHCTAAGVEDVIVILAILDESMDFDSIDNIGVRIVILLIVPESRLSQHIKTMASIAKLMSVEKVRDGLLDSKKPETALEIIQSHENNIKK